MTKQKILLTCPQMHALGERICTPESGIKLGRVSWKRFPDTFSNTLFYDVPEIRKSDVSVLLSLNNCSEVFERVSALLHLASLRPGSLKVFLPYFPTGTMELSDNEGQVPTAKSLAEFISCIAPAGPGVVPLYIWDIHALSIRSFFGRNVAPIFKSGMKYLKEWIGDRDMMICFPDQGAWKRFNKMFRDEQGELLYPVVICNKQHLNQDDRRVTIAEGDPRGRHVMIIDDLVHRAGTIDACGKVLMNAGALDVSVYATHPVMEQDAHLRIQQMGFARLLTSDSCPETIERIKDNPFYGVFSLEQSIRNTILEA